MSFVVLFKIYYYDTYVKRQLDRIIARIGKGTLYVIADETRGRVGDVDHDRVIRTTENDMLQRGLALGDPKFPMFWYNADYSIFRLFDDQPNYDYYVTIEYDAVINHSIEKLICAISKNNLDFVGKRITVPIAEWPWSKSCDKIYLINSIRPYLNMIGIYSGRAVRLLYDRRKEMSRQLEAGKIDQWPISEAFIATEIYNAGFSLGDLSDFGDVSRLDWWPPYLESDLGAMEQYSFIHPVLEGERYIDSVLRSDKLRTVFDRGSAIARRLSQLAPRDYLPKLMPKLVNQNRKRQPSFKIEEVKGKPFDQPDPSENIALFKHATQSSVSPHSRHTNIHRDAEGAVNGLVTGTFGFHTGFDEQPWWMVDLERIYHISEIWIFNRIDLQWRARHLRVLASKSGRDWCELYLRRSDETFGGAFGTPLFITFKNAPAARFIRIELLQQEHLHLDQVKIFGQPAEM